MGTLAKPGHVRSAFAAFHIVIDGQCGYDPAGGEDN